MDNQYKTEQENFWAGDFGDNYIERNQGSHLLASNLHFFSKALSRIQKIKSCIEFGANIGMNIQALKLLYPEVNFHGIEINENAARLLSQLIPSDGIINTSILDFTPRQTWDLVLIKGVLIHINPDELETVFKKLAAASKRYVLIGEYYNPEPVSIPYRGHKERLFKRDFANEFLSQQPDFELLDYGFAYRKDVNFPQDDITWFLLERRASI